MLGISKETVVCAYENRGNINEAFKRLFGMYLSNYSKKYSYGAIIDLPGALSYRALGDDKIEAEAKKFVERMSGECDGRFFCMIRQRRCISLPCDREYGCEGGALGALKSLWRFLAGRKNDVFPVYGCVPNDVGKVDGVYFSPCGEQRSGDDYCIEPNGIFRLWERVEGCDVAFPTFTGELKRRRSLIFGGACNKEQVRCEGLYTAGALDRLLSVGATLKNVKRRTVDGVFLSFDPDAYIKRVREAESKLIL